MRDQPPQLRRDHAHECRAHQVGPGGSQCPAGERIEEQEEPDRRGQHRHRVFGPERESQPDAAPDPVGGSALRDGAMQEQRGQRPQRQLQHVVIELHRGEVEEMQALEHDHREQRGLRRGDPATEPPYRVECDHAGERAEQIDDANVAGRPIGQILDPPGQRRMLPISELPFLAERQPLRQVELEVAAHQDGQRGPHQEVRAEQQRAGAARLAARQRDDAADAVRLLALRDRLLHRDRVSGFQPW